MNNFKFVPVVGSDKTIEKTEKVPGQMYFSKDGQILFDTPDGERIQIVKTDANQIHEQKASSSSWNINHNLNKYPSVIVIDSAGTEVKGDINYIDKNNITINFSADFTGKAYLNQNFLIKIQKLLLNVSI